MEYTQEMKELIAAIFREQGKREKGEKLERYRRLNRYVKPGQILFVGSSLMEQFPINELAMDLDLPYTIYNRGIGGFTTQELMEVMDVCVYDLKPSHIFINIGTNDLNGREDPLKGLMERYKTILEGIRTNLPQAKLHLMAYYPVNETVGLAHPYMGELIRYRNNRRIRLANEAVQALAEEMGASFHDFNEGLTDPEGNQKAEYTIEGMHIYPDGYMTVLERMKPVLEAIAREQG